MRAEDSKVLVCPVEWVTINYYLTHLAPRDGNGRIITGYGRKELEKAIYIYKSIRLNDRGRINVKQLRNL